MCQYICGIFRAVRATEATPLVPTAGDETRADREAEATLVVLSVFI